MNGEKPVAVISVIIFIVLFVAVILVARSREPALGHDGHEHSNHTGNDSGHGGHIWKHLEQDATTDKIASFMKTFKALCEDDLDHAKKNKSYVIADNEHIRVLKQCEEVVNRKEYLKDGDCFDKTFEVRRQRNGTSVLRPVLCDFTNEFEECLNDLELEMGMDAVNRTQIAGELEVT